MQKRSSRARRRACWLLSALVLTLYFSPQAQLLRSLPDTLSVARGQLAVLETPFPLTLSVAKASASTDETLGSKTTATISLFGLLPIREVDIDIADDLRLYPGGQAVGVALHTEGVLVVGTSDLTGAHSPARAAGVKPGDVITEAGGHPIVSTDEELEENPRARSAKLRVAEKC